MKLTKLIFTLLCAAFLSSCGNARMKDATDQACRLIKAYDTYIADPKNERAWRNIYTLQDDFNNTIETEGFKISEVKEAMTDCNENKELLEVASKIKLSNN